jgi:hypothetical protein
MLLIKLFRLKGKKIIGISLLIFLFSFGLQTSKDILTRVDSFENINVNQAMFSKNTKNFDQTNIAEVDQYLRNHRLFDHQLFHSNLLSFNNILDHRTNRFHDYQTLEPFSRLFLFNRTLRI